MRVAQLGRDGVSVGFNSSTREGVEGGWKGSFRKPMAGWVSTRGAQSGLPPSP